MFDCAVCVLMFIFFKILLWLRLMTTVVRTCLPCCCVSGCVSGM